MSFLNKLIDGKSLSKAALGQAIVQSVCSAPVIAPMQIALAVQMHQNFGSRFLIDTLHELGFCSSYREVLRYERNAATAQNLEIPESSDERFVQFMADNVDHNSRKMDGLNTFHGMGIMAAVNPARKYHKIIPRKTVSTADIVAASRIGIHYKQPVVNHDLTFRPLPLQISDDCWSNIDILWKTSWLLRPTTPLWNGTMQMVHYTGNHPGETSMLFMPMIDMDPSSETCIYSTLVFVAEQAKKNNVTPILTFDQPLWWKAQCLINAKPPHSAVKKTILRLGGLHMQMSFLGCIGRIMTDTGLKELFETVYADNTVPHMLTGKAIARSVRGHALAEMALNTILVAACYDINLTDYENLKEDEIRTEISKEFVSEVEENEDSDIEDDQDEENYHVRDCNETVDATSPAAKIVAEQVRDLSKAMAVFDDLVNHNVDIETAMNSKDVTKHVEAYRKKYQEIRETGRTSKLWI